MVNLIHFRVNLNKIFKKILIFKDRDINVINHSLNLCISITKIFIKNFKNIVIIVFSE